MRCYSTIREVGLVLQTCVLMQPQKQKSVGVKSGEHSGHFIGPPYPIVFWPNSVGNRNGRFMHYMEKAHHVKTKSICISKRQHFIQVTYRVLQQMQVAIPNESLIIKDESSNLGFNILGLQSLVSNTGVSGILLRGGCEYFPDISNVHQESS